MDTVDRDSSWLLIRELAAVSQILVVACGAGTILCMAAADSCLPGEEDGTVDNHACPLASWVVERWDDDGSSCSHLGDCRVERMAHHGRSRTRSSRISGVREETQVESTWWRWSDPIRPSKDGKGSDGEDHRGDSVIDANLERVLRDDEHADSSLARKASCHSKGALGLYHHAEHDDGAVVYETIEWYDRRREAFSFCWWVLGY